MTTVGIREFRAHMGEYLRRSRLGEQIELTDRGEVIARLVPAVPGQPAVEARMARIWQMVADGKAAWSGKKLRPRLPAVELPGAVLASDLILQEREDRDAGLSR